MIGHCQSNGITTAMPLAHTLYTHTLRLAGNSDYQPTTRTLTFSSSTTQIPVNIPIIEDDDVEMTETFSASLTVDSSRFPVTLEPSTADISILDNDGM